MSLKQKSDNFKRGFTIVELLIVIVVIAILAAITIVSYNGVTRQAHEAGLKSTIRDAATKIGAYNAENGSYPSSLSSAGIIQSNGNTMTYAGGGTIYCVDATNSAINKSYYQVQDDAMKQGTCVDNASTVAGCFSFLSGSINTYYNNVNNNGANPACPKAVIIPKQIGGVAVTSIAGFAFMNKSLTAVIIPDSVTTIGGAAFFNNSIAGLSIPTSVTSIAGGAFNKNQLPDSQAFIYKRNANGSQDTTTIVSYAGAKRSGIVIPSSITVLGDSSFFDTDITSITIPNSITAIGFQVFESCMLTSIVIPNSVNSIGNQAFRANQITSATIPSSVASIGSLGFANNALTAVSLSNATTIQSNTFDGGVTVSRY